MKKVIIIDDDKAILLAMAANLRADGYSVTTLDDGLKVSETLMSEKPNLIILDVLMPDVNGVEVLDIIRRQDPNLPVIVCSGAAELEPFMEYSNISAFMTKPVNFDELRHIVSQFAD